MLITVFPSELAALVTRRQAGLEQWLPDCFSRRRLVGAENSSLLVVLAIAHAHKLGTLLGCHSIIAGSYRPTDREQEPESADRLYLLFVFRMIHSDAEAELDALPRRVSGVRNDSVRLSLPESLPAVDQNSQKAAASRNRLSKKTAKSSTQFLHRAKMVYFYYLYQ